MKNALMVVSGVAIGLAFALVSIACGKSPTLPDANAQAAGPAGPGASSSSTIVATGGGTQNQNDLCWVLTKVKPVRGPERTVLSMYRAKRNGDYFDLEDVRMIDADIRIVELKSGEHKRANTDVPTILRNLPQAEQDVLKPPPEPPGNPR